MPTTEIVQVCNGDFIPVGVYEAIPNLYKCVPRRTCCPVEIEAYVPISASRFVDPLLFGFQKINTLYEFKYLESKRILAIFVPSILQMYISMCAVSQTLAVLMPSML